MNKETTKHIEIYPSISQERFNEACAYLGRLLHPRQKSLYWWLTEKGASEVSEYILMDWMIGTKFSSRSQVEPYKGLLSCLPQGYTYETEMRNVLTERISRLFSYLAGNPQLWENYPPAAWFELFRLARVLEPSDRSYRKPLINLFKAFEADMGSFPFASSYTSREAFSKLIARHQFNDYLKSRWIEMVKGAEDDILSTCQLSALVASMPQHRRLIFRDIFVPFAYAFKKYDEHKSIDQPMRQATEFLTKKYQNDFVIRFKETLETLMDLYPWLKNLEKDINDSDMIFNQKIAETGATLTDNNIEPNAKNALSKRYSMSNKDLESDYLREVISKIVDKTHNKFKLARHTAS